MSVIAMRGVTKTYGSTTALDDVSFALDEHRIHGLLGRNGAGKSTAMRILTGHEAASSGTVELFGEPSYENAGVLARTCFVQDSMPYPDRFTVRDTLALAAQAQPCWDQEFADRLVEEFELPDRRCRKLSRGQRTAVGIVIGLASRAPVTVFDEPTLGLDAVARQVFYDRLVADFAEYPRTVVLSTHLIDEVADLLEHVTVIDRGRVLLDEDADALRGRALTVSGPAESVERFARGHVELHREQLAGVLRLTLTGVDADPAEPDLRFGDVSLQELVVRTIRRPAESIAGTSDHEEPVL